jgi:prepilin-type N-terminal cleavage/methylation domain-containing protein
MMSPKHDEKNGFTLLEVVIVLFILGILAAMAVPAMGVLDDRERERITRERMDRIRRAVLGPDDRFDDQGRPVIGGYVGDMRTWPDLWEARAEIGPNMAGNPWDNPAALPAGLGQGPDYLVDPDRVFFRPFGRFVDEAWKWHRPYRRLYNDTTGNQDHIGGLETENEGQPRGLWTRFPEDLPFDLPGHPAPGLDLGENWKGPYIAAPVDENLKDSLHLAESDADFHKLLPVPRAFYDTDENKWYSSWEDGDYSPSAGGGEYFDEREAFRLLQNHGRLADAWNRSFRFFITEDLDHPGETVFWIISQGPDGKGTYPTKGTCAGFSWSVDPSDTMGRAYDEDDAWNRDNIVMKLYSRDWRAVFDAEDRDRIERTRKKLDRIHAALSGETPLGRNTGFSGDMCRWPRLFRWMGGHWACRDGGGVAYTKGQPRELWTNRPDASDPASDPPASAWGIGWRQAYLTPPHGVGPAELLRDAWNREILFFHDAAADAVLILSRGPSGRFSFGAVSADATEPMDFTELVDVTAYDPAAPDNRDNIFRVAALLERKPGYLRIDRLVVLNATVGVTKCCFFRDDGGADVLTASAPLTDEDGDGNDDDWAQGDGPANPAYNYNDTTAMAASTGARYLVCWSDMNGNSAIDSGEWHYPVMLSVTAAPGDGQYGTLIFNVADFIPAP